MSPFQALYDFVPPLHVTYVPRDSPIVAMDDLLRNLDTTIHLLRDSLECAQNWMKQFVNRQFQVKD